jgi:hypothetical protein
MTAAIENTAQNAPSSGPNSSGTTLHQHLLEWAHGRLTAVQVLELHPEITLNGMRIYARGLRRAKVLRDPETLPLMQSMAVYGTFLNEFRCRPVDYLKQEGLGVST